MTEFVRLVLLPPAMPLLLALIGLLMLVTRRRGAVSVIALGVLAGYLLSTPLVAAVLVGGLQPKTPVSEAMIADGQPQWIVVLAADKDYQRPDWDGETLSAMTLDRVRYGARLARQTGLPMLASGGNPDPRGDALADLMRRALREEYGIQRVVAENRSASTRENAVQSAAALRANNATRILLVTHAVHMRRAQASFVREGVQVVAAPTGFFNDQIEWAAVRTWLPSLEAIRASRYGLYERLAWHWYDWQGWVVDERIY